MGEKSAIREAIVCNLAGNFSLNDWLPIKELNVCLHTFNAGILIYVQEQAFCHNICRFELKSEAGFMAKNTTVLEQS
jgi:hypothetical protein